MVPQALMAEVTAHVAGRLGLKSTRHQQASVGQCSTKPRLKRRTHLEIDFTLLWAMFSLGGHLILSAKPHGLTVTWLHAFLLQP